MWKGIKRRINYCCSGPDGNAFQLLRTLLSDLGKQMGKTQKQIDKNSNRDEIK